MPVREVTSLRREGRLEEALQMAENDFANSADKYSASSIFWCLNDQIKTINSQEEIEPLYERMKALYEEYCPGDELMTRTMERISRQQDPFFQEMREGLANAKNGEDISELYRKGKEKFDAGNLNQKLFNDFGWIIYYQLKGTPLNDASNRKIALNLYLNLRLDRPSILHSLILGEAVKVERNTPFQFRIRDFMNLWGWENIRDPEDWQQFKSQDGNVSTSLVEKLISVYAKELKTDHVPSPEAFSEILDRSLKKFTNNQYLPLYKAYELISLGKPEEALDYYKSLLLKSPSKSFLWTQMSSLVDDLDLKIALLCKAISVERDESFIGKSRLKLAEALIEKGLHGNAKFELEKYRQFYASKGWSLKDEYMNIANRIAPHTTESDDHQIFHEYLPKADDLIYSSISEQIAIKVSDKMLNDLKRPGRKIPQWILRIKEGIVKLKNPKKFGFDTKMPKGSVFKVRVLEGKVVWIKKSQHIPLDQDWIKKIVGRIQLRTDRNGNPYAILDGVYIGQKLITGIEDNQHVEIISLLQENGRWSAISLRKKN